MTAPKIVTELARTTPAVDPAALARIATIVLTARRRAAEARTA